MGAVIERPEPAAPGGPSSDRASARPRRDRVLLMTLAALTLLAALLRFWRLSHQGFWFDEGNTALLVHRSLGRMLKLIPQSESTPPLYYCVAWVWARLFGFGEAGLRSLSALAGVLTVPLAYLSATRLLPGGDGCPSRRSGLIVAALTACSPLLIWYSQEARSYSLLVMLGAASLAAFAHAVDAPRRRSLAAWAIASALALGTHYYAVVMVVPQALWLLARRRRTREVQIAVAVVALCGLALIPLALSQNSTGHDSWIAHADLGIRLRQIIPQLLVGPSVPARVAVKFAALAATLLALGLLARRVPRERRRAVLAPAALALGGLLLGLAFAAAGSDALITRNLVGLWMPAAVAVAGGLALSRPAWPGLVLTGLLCTIGVTVALGVSLSTDLQRPDWRQVARVLGPRPAAGTERLVLIQHYRTLLPLSLYLPGLRFLRSRSAERVREIDVIGMQSPGPELCWWGAWCNLLGSGMQRTYAVAGFREESRRHVQHFTIVRLVAASPRTLTAAAVSRALRTTTLRRDDLLVQG